MAGYSPLKITGMSTGLVQERENFLLPDDAYPVLQNAYVWRERILRKRGYQLLGRLERFLVGSNFGMTGASPWTFNVFTLLGITETTATVDAVSFLLNGAITFIDNGDGTLSSITPGNSGIVNYATGNVTLIHTAGPGVPAQGQLNYFPGLPVMGIRTREVTDSEVDPTIFFDQKYAYIFNALTNLFEEYLAPTNAKTWNAANLGINETDFFWSTNYWISDSVNFPGTTVGTKLFWVTNNSGHSNANADPIRITDGQIWLDFTPPNYGQIDGAMLGTGNFVVNCLAMLPFRGRMVFFNTWEGTTTASARNFSNRIRWSTIGNPFIPFANLPIAKGSWRDDIRGQGGFLDIPTSEDIVSVGFVRDNLVIYCERSTWQLRYTGRSIAPFQIEKVNSELGAEGPFSAIQFDTSLVGIGDKGIVECDSYKSERIDIKIPDFVFQFQGSSTTPSVKTAYRVHGIRDFQNRLAYWTVPLESAYDPIILPATRIFPNTRLLYNYENDSWALFSDTLTALGTFQATSSRTWLNTHIPWIQCNFPWINQPQADPIIVGGNQQGFIEVLDELTANDVSLFITNMVQGVTVRVTSPNHNMSTGFVIGIRGIPATTPFSDLNNGVFGIIVINANEFDILIYNPVNNQFNIDVVTILPGTFVGKGLINIRDNFNVTSKKFNFLDEGQNIQLGYIDVLMDATGANNPGAISLNVYLDYDDVNPSNILPKNQIDGVIPATPDTFFNSIIPTNPSNLAVANEGSKFWQRVYCATRANFLTLQYTFSNAQMASIEQQQDVQIDAQILWIRRAGRMTSI